MQKRHLNGGEFLLEATDASAVYTPEEFDKDVIDLGKKAQKFVDEQVLPVIDDIDAHNFDHNVRLMKELGEAGFLKMETPEHLGGDHLDMVSAVMAAEKLGGGGSFSVTYMAHTGIGTFPLLYYGTKEQKEKYLGKLITGEWIGAYALTEPTSGSDALGAKATATLEGDHYVLKGRKQFITNAGFAKLFTVFAKVDGEHFSAFLVERDFEGVSTSEELDKMGIKGSSTRTLILDDVKVPKENLLGEVGKGHKIAFNILNIGRFKLGVAVTGGAKRAFRDAVKRAKSRKQFGTELMNFGAISEKIARMSANIYGMESMAYRLAGLLRDQMEPLDAASDDYWQGVLKHFEQYNVECAISKVFSSNALADIVDETVQIYGGYGFIENFPAARYYRDERINRIYEGTNEINRLLITGTVLKKGMKGELPLMQKAQEASEALMTPSLDSPDPAVKFSEEMKLIEDAKTLLLVLAGAAYQKFMDKLERQQEVLLALADIAIEIYAVESAVLRAKKHETADDAELREAMVRVFVFDAVERMATAARRGAFYIEDGDMLTMLLSGVRRFTKYNAKGLLDSLRTVAGASYDVGGYPLESVRPDAE